MSAKATRYTLAHEIGHAFGMDDIYLSNDQQKDDGDPLVELLAGDKVSFSHMPYDWNGGCLGHGSAGARYYRSGTSMMGLVGRLLMLGSVPSADVRRDISNGGIYGVYYYDYQEGKAWQKDVAPVGFPWSSRQPAHQ